MEKLIDSLEDNDDVQNVYHNWDQDWVINNKNWKERGFLLPSLFSILINISAIVYLQDRDGQDILF